MSKCVVCGVEVHYLSLGILCISDGWTICPECVEKHNMTYGEAVKSLKEKGYLE